MPDDDFAALLARGGRAGDPDAAAGLVRRYEPAIRVVVRANLADPNLRRHFDSVDVCQSVLGSFFARAAAGQYDLAEPAQLVALLARMTRNKLAGRARQYRRLKRDARRDVGEGALGQEWATVAAEMGGTAEGRRRAVGHEPRGTATGGAGFPCGLPRPAYGRPSGGNNATGEPHSASPAVTACRGAIGGERSEVVGALVRGRDQRRAAECPHVPPSGLAPSLSRAPDTRYRDHSVASHSCPSAAPRPNPTRYVWALLHSRPSLRRSRCASAAPTSTAR